jgi:hypothetical protein
MDQSMSRNGVNLQCYVQCGAVYYILISKKGLDVLA